MNNTHTEVTLPEVSQITNSDYLPKIPLSPIEHRILEQSASGKTPKTIAVALGIPVNTVSRFLAKSEVKEFIQAMTEARNQALLNYLPSLLMDVIEAKVERVQQDPDLSIADASKKDIVDIAKTISDIVKGSVQADKTETSGIVNFYQNLGFVAESDKTIHIIKD